MGQVFATFFTASNRFLNTQNIAYVVHVLRCFLQFYIATFSIFTCNLLLQFLSSIAQNLSVNKKDSSKLFKLVIFSLIAWKYFNIEMKSTVAQNENLAAKGVFGVRVPLRFFFSFRSNKNNPHDFFTDQ